jgi:hypothetical protein
MDAVSPTRDFWPPLEFVPKQQWLWRVLGTPILLTKEVDDTVALYTINFVHPLHPVLFRLFILKNISATKLKDIGIGVDAPADVPWPGPGHRSLIQPYEKDALLEVVSEPETRDPFLNQPDESQIKRHRYLIRKLAGGRTRGFQNLARTADELKPGEELVAVHYLAVSTNDQEDGVVEAARLVDETLEASGFGGLLQQTKDWWDAWNIDQLKVVTGDRRVDDALDAIAILEKVCEGKQGCFSVIEDYTFPFIRDLNGPHKFLLTQGKFEEVERSMDYIYAMDVISRRLQGAYPFDIRIPDVLPAEPDWTKVEPVMLGDVPSFRVLWYDWYVRCTGDLDYVSRRFNYLKGLILRQRLEETGYLAGYSYDETYGIGPIQEMRRGQAADNSFIFVAACERLARLARLLGKLKDSEELQTLAQKVRFAIESKLWLEDHGHYAMRIDEHGRLDPTPISPALLRPIWIGYAMGDDDHAIRSVEYVLKKMLRDPGFIKLLPGEFQSTVGHIMAYLLYCLCEMNHPKADWAFGELLRYVDAGGTFSEYYDYSPQGPVTLGKHGGHFARPWESGVNGDIMVHYLTGFSPDALEGSFTLKPRFPDGTDRMEIRNIRMRDSRIHLVARKDSRSHLFEVEHHGGQKIKVRLDVVLPSTVDTKNITVSLNGGGTSSPKLETNRWGVSILTLLEEVEPESRVLIGAHW